MTKLDENFKQASDLSATRFECCSFTGIDLRKIDLSEKRFEECSFIDCQFGSNNLRGTALQDVTFRSCKITGLEFDNCSPMLISLSFDASKIELCSFVGLKFHDFLAKDSSFNECDFSSADLAAVAFTDCSLSRSQFVQSNLEKADFSSAINFDIDPSQNRMKGAKFSAAGLGGLLRKFNLNVDA